MGNISFQPSGKVIKARTGTKLIYAAHNARVMIPQRCGGRASCLMCKVVVEEGSLQAITPLEANKLSPSELALGVRLACQAKVAQKSCVVRIPDSKLKSVVAQALQRLKEEQTEG